MASGGVRILTWVGLMYATKALLPFTVALTLSSCVGMVLFTKSGPYQLRESPAGARLAPAISTQVLGAMMGLPLSAFTTAEIKGGEAMVKSDSINTTAYGFQVESV